MGNAIKYLKPSVRSGVKRGVEVMSGEIADDDEDELFNALDRELRTPKRRKIMSTSQYIYKALFEDGKNSDITIVALNYEWRLHKVYLCQSPYFSSMFSGAWTETNDNEIHIEIADPNIDVNSLKIVLGSLYQDEITIEPVQVIPVLGAAILFQLDPLIRQCCEIMKESVNIQTVITYYEMADQYGLENIRKNCFDWLLRNLLSYIPEHPKLLRDISSNLMTKLVNSSELFVVQTEFSIYLVLKMWVFLRVNLDWDGQVSEAILEAHRFFQTDGDQIKPPEVRSNGENSYLTVENGVQYKEAFQALRLQHLINHHMDVEMLEVDNILPREWLSPIFRMQWYRMLRVDQGIDKGPKELSEKEFNETCLRCGRILPTDTHHMWRWTGYNFGLDLIVSYDKRSIRFRRNNRNTHDHHNSVTDSIKRHVLYKVTLASINDKKQLIHTATTGMQSVTLNKNEEVRVMLLDKEVTFPLILSANFVFLSPIIATNLLAVEVGEGGSGDS